MTTTPNINLGDEARDTLTGFSGIVVASTHWLHGCERLVLQPRNLVEGKMVNPETFDILQCELVTANVMPTTAPPPRATQAALDPSTPATPRPVTGGPRPDAERRVDPAHR